MCFLKNFMKTIPYLMTGLTLLVSVCAEKKEYALADQILDASVLHMGEGDKKMSVIVSPFCAHCQTLLQDIAQWTQENPQKGSFHITFPLSMDQVRAQNFTCMLLAVAKNNPSKMRAFFENVEISDIENSSRLKEILKCACSLSEQEAQEAKKQMAKGKKILEKENITSVPVILTHEKGEIKRNEGYQKGSLSKLLNM